MRLLLQALPFFALAAAQQIPLEEQDDSRNDAVRVAIIGGGVAGASVASRLASFSSVDALHITLFERERELGGRVKSVVPDADWAQGYPLETGADGLTYADDCFFGLSRDSVAGYTPDADIQMQANDQQLIQAQCYLDVRDWRSVAQLVLKYGTRVLKVRSLVQSITSGWKKFLPSGRGTGDLTSELYRAGFSPELFGRAGEYFADLLGQGSTLEEELLQPCSQARYHESHAEVNALSALLAERLTGVAHYTGIQEMIKRPIEYSKADVHLESYVKKITPGDNRKYKLHWVTSLDKPAKTAEFDFVVLATPSLPAEIDIDVPGLDSRQLNPIAYDERHVTYFASPLALTDALQDALNVVVYPDYVRTSVIPLWNITSVRTTTVCSWTSRCDDPYDRNCNEYSCQNLYKIVSRAHSTDQDMSAMLNHNSRGRKDFFGTLPPGGVTWSLREEWLNGLPQHSETIPTSVEVAPGLFYTSGLEHVIPTMEMSCRMGRYVADKILSK